MANKTFYTPLDNTSKVGEQYLPSYVDDVVEYTNLSSFPLSGETGKIYVALDTDTLYRWTGSNYVSFNSSGASFDLSDRIAKGINQSDVPVSGAVIEGDIQNNSASGTYSHAGGLGTTATATAQTVIGKYNEPDNDSLFIVGNGSDINDRSNAFEIKTDGTIVLANGTELTPEDFFAIKNAYISGPDFHTVTLVSNGWSLDNATGYYKQSLTVLGITANSHPRATIVYPDGTTENSKVVIDTGASYLVNMVTDEDTVVFYAVNSPSVNLTIELFED